MTIQFEVGSLIDHGCYAAAADGRTRNWKPGLPPVSSQHSGYCAEARPVPRGLRHGALSDRATASAVTRRVKLFGLGLLLGLTQAETRPSPRWGRSAWFRVKSLRRSCSRAAGPGHWPRR